MSSARRAARSRFQRLVAGIPDPAVVWHELERDGHGADLALWLELAHGCGGTVLDVGAGTGRVALTLAKAGIDVVALDCNPVLLAELQARAESLPLTTVAADARAFELPGASFSLVIAANLVAKLGGDSGREAFLRRARAVLAPAGIVAVTYQPEAALDEFEWHAGERTPLPDILEHGGHVFCSQPAAARRRGSSFELVRRREHVDPDGRLRREWQRATVDVLSAAELKQAGQRAGLRAIARRRLAPTALDPGCEVVMLGV
jgi:ubiquinone/menaquinone biosynthesis C-methylase UbiE